MPQIIRNRLIQWSRESLEGLVTALNKFCFWNFPQFHVQTPGGSIAAWSIFYWNSNTFLPKLAVEFFRSNCVLTAISRRRSLVTPWAVLCFVFFSIGTLIEQNFQKRLLFAMQHLCKPHFYRQISIIFSTFDRVLDIEKSFSYFFAWFAN